MNRDPHAHQPIGQTLIALGLISTDQLHIALREQTRTREIIGRQLVRLGFLSEATLRDALARSLDQASADLSGLLPDAEALALVPRQAARRLGLIPLSYDALQRHLVVAASNTGDIVAQDQLRSLLPGGATVELRLAGDSEIACAIDLLYGHELSIDGILHEIETGEADTASLTGRGDTYAQPVVRLIDALLADAVKRGASDL
ncbi:MAG TPA: secretion system protein E, partial [Zoogloea sp.]|nr:secretion system protein E [Zoogloea sp.]